ncbi:E3 ubiquitin-protein ligase RHF2A-like protein [Medicago truncatula]|uniref:RING-type E3 ubiquitin transferase n=1 Tax=Medicago truncatula TaxID=3880 RepID=A0A072UER6_MEDTR|nr:E3 ubiquitin-protein ligase RHF2A-like protein [Medicago truncatula]
MSKTSKMETNAENHMTSAAAFVEGGIQESCDDACCICLEEFCDNDPSTATACRHEFHLQCVLEWGQRSSQCPMCWQPISLKDPTGQELFEAVEQERKWRVTPSRNIDIFHSPTLGGFGFQHLHMGVNGSSLEERLLQNLAIVASIGRTHHVGRREGQQIRPSGHEREDNLNAIHMSSQSTPITSSEDEPLQQILKRQTEGSSTSRSTVTETNDQETYSNDRDCVANSSPINQNRERSSEFHSFSDTLRSKLNAVSMRYKESISNGTRGWKERLFSRSSTMSEFGSNSRKR